MAPQLASTAVLLLFIATSATMGFRLNESRSDVPQRREPPVLYKAVVHLDGRPTEVLEDTLGNTEDLRFQTGDKMSTPWPFIGAYGTVMK